MSDDEDDEVPGPEPTEIGLPGDGPFQLPLCTELAFIGIGESLAVLQFETIDGQRIDLPVPIGMLEQIKAAAEEALLAATAQRGGSMVQ